MRYALPAAHEVDGDLLVASKSLVWLGWSTPAVLTARTAYETALWAVIDSRGWRGLISKRRRPLEASRLLRKRGVISSDQNEANRAMYDRMSNVAHGKPVKLFEAVALVETAERQLTILEGLL